LALGFNTVSPGGKAADEQKSLYQTATKEVWVAQKADEI
jgi:hypothetical protein